MKTGDFNDARSVGHEYHVCQDWPCDKIYQLSIDLMAVLRLQSVQCLQGVSTDC